MFDRHSTLLRLCTGLGRAIFAALVVAVGVPAFGVVQAAARPSVSIDTTRVGVGDAWLLNVEGADAGTTVDTTLECGDPIPTSKYGFVVTQPPVPMRIPAPNTPTECLLTIAIPKYSLVERFVVSTFDLGPAPGTTTTTQATTGPTTTKPTTATTGPPTTSLTTTTAPTILPATTSTTLTIVTLPETGRVRPVTIWMAVLGVGCTVGGIALARLARR